MSGVRFPHHPQMTNLFDIPHIIAVYGYAGILSIIFLESGIFFLLPGDSLIFTVGLLANKLGYNVFLFTFLTTVFSFLGGLVGYYIGVKLDYFYRFAFRRKILPQKYLNEAHEFLEKHGLFSIMLSRFVPVIRTFLPIVAGMARMNFLNFIRYSLLSCAVWSVTFILGGYYLGQIFPATGDYLSSIILIIVVMSILPGVIHFFKKRK